MKPTCASTKPHGAQGHVARIQSHIASRIPAEQTAMFNRERLAEHERGVAGRCIRRFVLLQDMLQPCIIYIGSFWIRVSLFLSLCLFYFLLI